MQSFKNFREQVKASKLWVFQYKIFNYISIQIASFPNFFYSFINGAYERSGILKYLCLINILISKLFLSLFDITIRFPDENGGTLIDTFLNNVFAIFLNIKYIRFFPSKIVVFDLPNFNVYKLSF